MREQYSLGLSVVVVVVLLSTWRYTDLPCGDQCLQVACEWSCLDPTAYLGLILTEWDESGYALGQHDYTHMALMHACIRASG